MQVIYIPLLFICMLGDCKFYQSINYTYREQDCKDEVKLKTTQAKEQGAATAEGVCVDVDYEKMKEITGDNTQSAKFILP